MPLSNRVLFLLIISLISLLSCDPNRVFDVYKSVPNTWHKDSIIGFTIHPPDSLKGYHLFINLRNTNAYKYSNLFLVVDMIYPHGKIIKDTLEYRMADPTGKLLGTGYTHIKENKLWYKGHDSDFVFNEKGAYTINIQHAMRAYGETNGIVELEGVTDIGFRVENKITN